KTMFAIDWDHQQLCFVKTKSARGTKIIDAGQIPFDSITPQREQLAAALKELTNGAKAAFVVARGAGSVETATVMVPPASDAELPLFVQNLCRQELSITESEPALDYLAGEPNEDGSRTVTAMLLREEPFNAIRETIESCGGTIDHVVLRPHALAAFLSKGNGLRIAVSASSDFCDMLIVSDDQPVAVRSLRLPADGAPAQLGRHCVGELKRTMFAMLEEPNADEPPVEIVVLGSGDLANEVAAGLTTDFGVNATLQNPFDEAQSETSIEDVGSVAGLVGAVSSKFDPPVDFANPRRPPKEASRAKPVLIAAACLLAVVGAGSWYIWSQFNELDQENARLEEQVRELNELARETKPKRDQAKAIAAWEAGRFSWLDEIRYLTETMPPRSDMTINRLSISGGRRTATVSFNGIAKKPDAVDRMEQAIRDENHAPRTPGLRDRSGGQQAGWSFQTTMKVRPRPAKQYRDARKETSR
ncbi:MAG: hypothetical protein AB8G99_10935, partial [Planctomycetaceae bacterium]